MKLISSKIGIISVIFLTGALIAVGFQNCARTQFSASKSNQSLSSSGTNYCALNPSDSACIVITPLTCTFNGELVANGQSITAYQNSSGVCNSEKRVCNNGQLSGSFNYATCSPHTPKACLFDGKTIDSGKSIKAYLSSSAAAGTQCKSENRICNDGVLSGSYSYGSCEVSDFAGCLFNGQTIAHGGNTTAYQNSSVVAGQTCKSEVRQCVNGDLTGTFNFASCTVAQPAACTFNGQTIAHGQTVTAFLSSTVPTGQTCQSQIRTCTNGVLSGSNSFASCSVSQPASCTFNGQTVANGASALAYLNGAVGYGASCAQESRICNNGTLSGSYTFANCSVSAAANCQFNGQTIAHGQTVKSFLASTVAYGQACQEQTRTCNNGTLSGTYSFASCAVGAPASCNFNGQNIAHGATVTGFQSSAVAFGQACVSETKICNNGSLSGGYTFASCTVGAAASCNFNGQNIVHGQSITAFQSATVSAGTTTQACTWQPPAAFGGTYGCRAYNPEGTCPYSGATSSGYSCLEMRPGGDVWTSKTGSMRCVCTQTTTGGESCSSQTRTCNNGVLSGTFAFSSCSATGTNPVPQNQSCNFNGQTIVHGAGVTAYAASSVAAGQACASQYRTCNNGVLSGSYSANSCSVQQAASCNFNGQQIPSGGTVTAYSSSTVAYGQNCAMETRYCNNGALSGSFGASSCAAQQAVSCSTQQTGALYCGSKTVCPDGTEVTPATTMTATGTISSAAHGQYSYVTSTNIGSATNIRYRCDQGTFVWDPSGPTSCTAPNTYLPASDARCKKSCTPFQSNALCFIKEVCPNGMQVKAITLTETGVMGMNVSGGPGQTATVTLANLSGIKSNLSIQSFTWPIICDPNGTGVWKENATGNCNATLTVPASDPRCQWTGGDGG